MIEPYQAIGLVPTMRGPEADASPSRAVAGLSGCRDRGSSARKRRGARQLAPVCRYLPTGSTGR